MNNDMDTAVSALERLLKQKGVTDEAVAEQFRHTVTEEWLPRNGARLCARAWVDPQFREWLLADGAAAAKSMGFGMPEHHRALMVKENTETLHNVICCTLCSCTAFSIIGMAPGWYKDLEYRARIVRQARTVLGELGLSLAPAMEIRVWDTTADHRYMILPLRPAYTEGWSEMQLADLVTKESMIGVARLEPPYRAVATPATH